MSGFAVSQALQPLAVCHLSSVWQALFKDGCGEPGGRHLEPGGFPERSWASQWGSFLQLCHLVLSHRCIFPPNLNSKYTMSAYCVPGSGDVTVSLRSQCLSTLTPPGYYLPRGGSLSVGWSIHHSWGTHTLHGKASKWIWGTKGSTSPGSKWPHLTYRLSGFHLANVSSTWRNKVKCDYLVSSES